MVGEVYPEHCKGSPASSTHPPDGFRFALRVGWHPGDLTRTESKRLQEYFAYERAETWGGDAVKPEVLPSENPQNPQPPIESIGLTLASLGEAWFESWLL